LADGSTSERSSSTKSVFTRGSKEKRSGNAAGTKKAAGGSPESRGTTVLQGEGEGGKLPAQMDRGEWMGRFLSTAAPLDAELAADALRGVDPLHD
jgi:hypothetical protein